MSRPDRINLANDNSPVASAPKMAKQDNRAAEPFSQRRGRRGHSRIESQLLPRAPISFAAPNIPEAAPLTSVGSSVKITPQHSGQHSSAFSRPRKVSWGLFFSLLATIICLSLAAVSFYTAQSERLSVMALFATVWAGLWTAFLAAQDTQPQSAKRVGEWCVIVATFAGLGIWNYAAREWGLPISAADGAAIFAGLAFITALLLRSKISLLTSACAGLVWAAFNIFAPAINLINPWAYPALALLHLRAAGRMGSKSAAFITLTGLHLWLGWVLLTYAQSGDISALHVAAILAMIGTAHYRIGKAAGDAGWVTSNLHVVTGWSAALIGFLALQHYWLGMDTQIWDNISATAAGHLSWQITGIASIGLVGIAGLVRLYYQRLSGLGAFLTLVMALAAALIFDQRESILSAGESGRYAEAQPLLGIMIGAAILASALAMAINGARRKSSAMLIAGLIGIGAQLFLLLSPQIWSAEAAALFSLSLTVSLLLAALLANDSSAQGERSQRRRAAA